MADYSVDFNFILGLLFGISIIRFFRLAAAIVVANETYYYDD